MNTGVTNSCWTQLTEHIVSKILCIAGGQGVMTSIVKQRFCYLLAHVSLNISSQLNTFSRSIFKYS